MGCGCGKNKRKRIQSSRMPPVAVPQNESQKNNSKVDITPNQRRSEIAKLRNTRRQISRERQKQFKNMTIEDHVNNRKPK